MLGALEIKHVTAEKVCTMASCQSPQISQAIIYDNMPRGGETVVTISATTTLTLATLTNIQVMTPLDKTFMLGLHQKLDMDTMADIISSGPSAHHPNRMH